MPIGWWGPKKKIKIHLRARGLSRYFVSVSVKVAAVVVHWGGGIGTYA